MNNKRVYDYYIELLDMGYLKYQVYEMVCYRFDIGEDELNMIVEEERDC